MILFYFTNAIMQVKEKQSGLRKSIHLLNNFILMSIVVSWDGVMAQNVPGKVKFSLGRFQNLSVTQNFPVEAVLTRIPGDITHIIFQFHSQYRNATISYDQAPTPNTSLTAHDAGLVSTLRLQQSSLQWYMESPEGKPVSGMAVILPYKARDPVPGGCNLEYNLDTEPNIYLHYNLFETIIRFAPANIGYARGQTAPPCDVSSGQTSRKPLEYDVYQYFLPEGDLSEQVFIGHIQKMADIHKVVANGKKLMTLSSNDQPMVSFSSLPGQGVIYSIIVRDPVFNTSASYVPVHTYACSFTSTLDNCYTLGKISTKVFFTIAGMAGLFICFFGHRFFKSELFCMGFIFTAFLFFMLITRTTPLSYDMRLSLTALMGVVGGVLLVLCWWRFGSHLLSILIVGLVLGFLFSSMFFFTPIGDFEVFHSDVVFWLTFTSIALVVPLICVRFPREGNITACGVVGGYTVILAVNSYTYTSLTYITLDILKRALNNNFSKAFTNIPFQGIDFIMFTVWAVLTVSGMVLQLYRERTRPVFHRSPYMMWKQERERRKTNILDPSYHVPPLRTRLKSRVEEMFRKEEPAGERTPLLL
ncbi:transmembrane 7 superfamily member 3-like isoform X1 [Polyodon spathula]|uniref:transmembrane 7 superfamily member 3-like isoform X1 n=1 Tax=Polyodon spathula TaxID=7913 RepID=UPI001B7EB1AD|nr:transmembrane 7 superfamily member 3-like isoform X1 [Polyodon spathula]